VSENGGSPLEVVKSNCDGCHRPGVCDHVFSRDHVRGRHDSSRH
jgi:hypothetical protein